MKSIDEIQDEVQEWGARNFPDATPLYCVLGLQEEVGELSRVHLKRLEKIKPEQTTHAIEKDVVGDIAVLLIYYCALAGLDFETVLNETWEQVRQRDYTK
jgi:NTP pyrophosphatase (non-canonical NTP hydrolase)